MNEIFLLSLSLSHTSSRRALPLYEVLILVTTSLGPFWVVIRNRTEMCVTQGCSTEKTPSNYAFSLEYKASIESGEERNNHNFEGICVTW